MITIEESGLGARIALTLAHVLWQGTVVGILCAVSSHLGRRRSPSFGYRLHSLGLAALMVGSIATFVFVNPATSPENSGARSVEIPEPRTLSQNPAIPEFSPPKNSLETPSSTGDWKTWIGILYATGLFLASLRLGISVVRSRGVQRRSQTVRQEWLLQILRQQTTRIGLRCAPALRVSQEILVPIVVGVLRPVILLPATTLVRLEAEQIRWILTHELSHIRRFDPVILLFQRGAETLLYFHPAVWYLSRQIQLQRELCCDSEAVASGAPPRILAESLVEVSELRKEIEKSAKGSSGNLLGPAALGRESTLSRRVRHLLGKPPTSSPCPAWGPVAALASGSIALFLLLFGFSGKPADSEPSPRKDELHMTPLANADQILEAASEGRWNVVEAMLSTNPELAHAQAEGEWGWTPLNHASYHGKTELVRSLIELGADVTVNQPIHYAGQQGHRTICELLVDQGAVDDLVDDRDPDVVAFFRAVYSYRVEEARNLLDINPALVHARDKEGRTALIEAGTNNAVEIIDLLLERGAHLDRERSGGSVAERASGHRHHALVRSLVNRGAEIELWEACRSGVVAAIPELLARTPDRLHEKRHGHSLIEWVCEDGSVEVGRKLVDAGAEVDVFTAASLGLIDKLSAFLDADPTNAKARRPLYGYQPLHCAAECGQKEAVELLLDRGAEINPGNDWGATPLFFAIISGRETRLSSSHLEICRLLIDRGSDLKTNVNDSGSKAVAWAKNVILHHEKHELDSTVPRQILQLLERHSTP